MASSYQILVVADDITFGEVLREGLAAHAGFSVALCHTASNCLVELGRCPWDLLILDAKLSDMSGREACKRIRKDGFTAPIIALADDSDDANIVLDLEAGANDCVTKPFRFSVLLARVRAQLRQHAHNEDVIIKLGPYQFQPSAKVLIEQDGGRIRLTAKETSILKFLYRSSTNLASRDVLLREVWGYKPNIATHTLETHIYRLRQKIEPDPANANLLRTEAGGYRLVL